MNRVVQSPGRVIRSETDRGIIVLVGQRFGYANYTNLFPGIGTSRHRPNWSRSPIWTKL